MNKRNIHDHDPEEMMAQLNALVEELEHYPDSEVREKALDLVQIVLQLYGEALRRVFHTLDSLPQKDQILSRLAGDDVVRAILAIHGLLPTDLRDRVAARLDQIRALLISQGADVELIEVEDGVARMRLMRSGKGAPQIEILKSEIESNLMEAAPDLLGIEIEGFDEHAEAAKLSLGLATPNGSDPWQSMPRLIQIKRPKPDKSSIAGAWVPIIKTSGLPEGEIRVISFGEHNLLMCRINAEFYGYRNACADGKRSLDEALLEGSMLTCACHGYSYDLRRNGACVERPDLRLESLPVIVEDERVKVAL